VGVRVRARMSGGDKICSGGHVKERCAARGGALLRGNHEVESRVGAWRATINM